MLRQLWTMTASDIRLRIRDKSVPIFGLLVPFALIFVMNLVFGDTGDTDLDAVTVAAAQQDSGELGAVVVDAVTEVPGIDLTVTDVPASEIRPLVEAGDAQLGITVPADFTENVTGGQGAQLKLIQGESAAMEVGILTSVIEGVTGQFAAAAEATTAAAGLALPPDEAGRIAQQVIESEARVSAVEGRTATEQLGAGASIVAGQAGLFLLFTVGFGVLALLNERQQGTLARLQAMPMPPGLVVLSKALSSFILGVVATLVLLTAGSLLFGVSFGAPLTVLVLVLCVVAAGTSLMFIIARVARTPEQAGVMQSIFAIVLGVAGGAFFPITASGPAGMLLDLNPVAAFTRGLGISAGGGGLGDISQPVLIMLGFAVAALVVSRLVPDRGAAA